MKLRMGAGWELCLQFQPLSFPSALQDWGHPQPTLLLSWSLFEELKHLQERKYICEKKLNRLPFLLVNLLICPVLWRSLLCPVFQMRVLVSGLVCAAAVCGMCLGCRFSTTLIYSVAEQRLCARTFLLKKLCSSAMSQNNKR